MSIFLLAANKEKTNIIEVNFYNPEPLFFAAKLLVMTSLESKLAIIHTIACTYSVRHKIRISHTKKINECCVC